MLATKGELIAQGANEPALKRLCLERLANYKVPKQFVFVDAMPRTAAGDTNKDAFK